MDIAGMMDVEKAVSGPLSSTTTTSTAKDNNNDDDDGGGCTDDDGGVCYSPGNNNDMIQHNAVPLMSSSSSEKLRRHQRFILGHCENRGNVVEWMEFDKREIAYEHYYVIKTFLHRSVVLFEDITLDDEKNDEPVHGESYQGADVAVYVPIMTSGQHHSDVAVILTALQIRKEQQIGNHLHSTPCTTTTVKAGCVEESDSKLLDSSKIVIPKTTEPVEENGWASRILAELPIFESPVSPRTSIRHLSRRWSTIDKNLSFVIRRDRSTSLDVEAMLSSSDSTLVNRDEIEQRVRDGDAPVVPPGRSWIEQFFVKRSIDLLFHRYTVAFFAAGPRRMTSLYSFPLHKYPSVLGHVALTIDDAPGRFGPRNSQLDVVRELLAEYDAKATFMVVGKFIPGHEEQMIRLLEEGHEFGNHGISDQAHHTFDSDDDFLQALDDCNARIEDLQRQHQRQHRLMMMTTQKGSVDVQQPLVGVRYFRAPHGKYTKRMEELIQSRNMVNVMCDAFAADPIVEDGDYIARSLTRQARDGGILLLHIPERGFRDYCLVALKGLLEGLKRRKLKVVTVGMLEALAKRGT